MEERSSDNVDEFAGVAAPRTRHPALVAGVVLLAAYLIFHVRSDLTYALSSSSPRDVGDARSLFAPGAPPLPENRLVRVQGMPDRESALELDTKGSWKFSQFFRVLGTGNQLFIHRPEDPLPRSKAERDVFVGRLIPVSNLPFEGAIRGYFSKHVSATHFFRVSDLAAAAGRSEASLRDSVGDTLTIGAGDVLAIDILRPDELRVGLPRKQFATEDAARAAIEPLGATVIGTLAGTPDQHILRITIPAERRDTVFTAIGELDRNVEIRPARDTHRARLQDLAVEGQELVIRNGKEISVRAPFANVHAVRTLSPVQIPQNAYLVIEGDLPRDHMLSVGIVALLALLATVNLLGLRRGLRGI